MNKLWLVAWHEYTRHVLRRRFTLVALSLPLVFGATLLFTYLMVRLQENNAPVGIVDPVGVLEGVRDAGGASIPGAASVSGAELRLLPYPSEAEANLALEGGLIQAYFVFPADFMQTGQARAVALEELNFRASEAIESALRSALLAGLPQQVVERISQGSRLEVVTLDGSRRITTAGFLNLFIPIFAYLFLILSIFITSGYLMQSITEERENRTLEVMVTSLSADQLMAGKTIGIVAVGLTQLAIWGLIALVGLWLFGNRLAVLDRLQLSPGLALLMLVTLLPAMLIIASGMAAIGALVSDMNEGQQISGPFSLPFLIPFLFILPILRDPGSPLALWLTFIPFTAPTTLVLRAALASVPPWQIALSLAGLFLTALAFLWLAGRAFRLGMLSYGRPWSLAILLAHFKPARWKRRPSQT